jgi:scyllo-inositol 2-dehydrogenase (NADP+)
MIKIGIIGAGRMGITHYSIINSHPDIEVVAVADPSSLITVIIEKYLKVPTFKDYKAMFEKVNLDAVLLCTPPFLNYEILKAAAALGIHAFVEKPYTTSANQAKEMADLYENKGLVNQVGYVNRFNDVFIKVKELINDDVIGNPIRFRTEMFSRTVIQDEEGSGWRSTRENGGGAVFEMASHSIDLMNFILGAPDRVIGTTLTRIYSKNVEDIVSSTFVYKSGLTGTLYVNWSDESFRKPTNKIEFFGTKGKILADQHGFKIYLKEENKKLGYREGWNTIYITDVFKSVPFYLRGNEFTNQLYHFVDCIQKNSKTTECSFREGYKTLSVIEEMFKDNETQEKLSV